MYILDAVVVYCSASMGWVGLGGVPGNSLSSCCGSSWPWGERACKACAQVYLFIHTNTMHFVCGSDLALKSSAYIHIIGMFLDL